MTQQKTRVYLAGPMTGHAQHNFPIFDHVAAKLEAQGYEVYNPAELTRAQYLSVDNFLSRPEEEQLASAREYLAKELAWICRYADAICLLPGWENSFGARAEHEAARAVKIKVLFIPEDMLPEKLDG